MGSSKRISHIVITDGKELDKLTLCVNGFDRSAQAAGQVTETILVGNVMDGLLHSKLQDTIMPLILVPAKDHAAAGRLGAMRNIGCQISHGNMLVVTDDDMMVSHEFVARLLESEDQGDVFCGDILNPDGTRFWGWATYSQGISKLADYDDPDDGTFYATGGLIMIRRSAWLQVRWNDTLGFYQGEDVDYSNRLHAAGYKLQLIKGCTAVHSAPYTQAGLGVRRL